ncbi:MAG: TRAP transporter fused permease subunit [Burkholderiales bacterium]|jgi:TRAP transporter 4TM/12TM fusion protein|nr:TRAP transporter fused permease subunit [Burkholderiales bacterium]
MGQKQGGGEGLDAALAQVSDDALAKAEEFVEEEEGALNRFGGALGIAVALGAIAMSLFHLYAAYWIVPAMQLRGIHVGFALVLTFLLYPVAKRYRDRLQWFDIVAAVLAVAAIGWMLYWGDDFGDRATDPTTLDQVFGVMLILLILEATRRSSGWVMPFVVVLFVVYAMAGPYLPPPWTHRGYDVSRLVGQLYMTLEGIFGVAIDVCATLIILFTIYGAFLQFSKAGKFFIDFSFAAMGGKPSSAGRAVVLGSFLLGGPSGSGVATTVTLGSVAYPLLSKSGYERNAAGGLLAAGGLGAILSPPVLGAAAFLIAEFLKISYLDVILMATIPTLLYYFGIFLMVEMDARKYAMHDVPLGERDSLATLTRRYGFHFLSLAAIVVFMLMGYSPMMSVFWAVVVVFALSFIQRDTALIDYDVFTRRIPFVRGLWDSGLRKALESGSTGILNVSATCASAGVIVGVVTLTGLGLKFSAIVLAYADGGAQALVQFWGLFGVAATAALLAQMKLLLTAIFTALIVWIVGLAVPVTASYIICAVIAAPALIKLGVPDFAAHMFIFYYAVLSEVSPPTALSPFAAAAITGGDPYKTTLQSWKYTMPAFLVPFMFVLDPAGTGLLLTGSFKTLEAADWGSILVISAAAAIGITALAAGLQGWLFKGTTRLEKWILIAAGVAIVYPSNVTDVIGVGGFLLAIFLQWLRRPSRSLPA